MKKDDVERADRRPAPQTWTRPKLKYIGNVGDVLEGGGGKLSPTVADTGDMGKPPGQN